MAAADPGAAGLRMKPPQDSRVTPVVEALKTICETIDDLQVIVGTFGRLNIGKSVLSLAVGRDSVHVKRTKMPGLTPAYLEEMTVKYRLSCWSGSGDVAAQIVRCEEVRNAIRVALDADGHLGGVVDSVLLGLDDAWDTGSSTSGPVAAVNSTFLTKAVV
jgi:hypothetical protein